MNPTAQNAAHQTPKQPCYHVSLFSCGFPILRKPIVVIESRRRRLNRIAASSTSSNGGGVQLDEEFKFKPSFDEFLKAMEAVKIDRDGNGSYSNIDRGRKNNVRESVPEEMEADDVPATVKDNTRRGSVHRKESGFAQEGFRKEGFRQKEGQLVREDSRKEGFGNGIYLEKVKKKQNRNFKNLTGRNSGGNESEFLDVERAAFRTLDDENFVIDNRKITKVDMEERIQKLAKSLNGADIDIPEWKFSKMILSARIRFSDHSILRIIQILGKLGNWRRVLQVIEWIQSRERYKSHNIRYIYTAALDALGKAKRPVEAFNLFRRMQEQLATYPDIAAYHCIVVTLGQAGHMKELFDVIDTMKSPPKKKFKTDLIGKWDPRLEPDVIVYNAVLNACVQCKKWEGAFWVLQKLSQQGQQPSCTTYGLIMEVMLACGKYNLVHDLFKKIQKSHIPNALIYKVVVNTSWKEGKTDEAIMVVKEMERRGIVGNAALYYDLARCLCSAGRCHEALEQIEKLCKVASKPLVVTYTGLIQACLDSGDIKSGEYIFNVMQKFCSPNLITYNILLKAFVDHKMFEEAKQLFLRLLENASFIGQKEDYKVRVIPDIYSFNTVLDACHVERKWDDLEFVYKQMLWYGHHFNAKRHLWLLLDARRAGKERILEMTWRCLIQTERAPHPLLVTEMFCMKLEKGDCAAALSYIINFAPAECQVFSKKSWLKFFFKNGIQFDERTIDGLVCEASIVLAKAENPAVEHMLGSCKEFLKTHRTSTDVKMVQVANRP